MLVRRSCQSLFKSKPQHRILSSIQMCLVSFKGKRTASQGPSFSWEALTTLEGQFIRVCPYFLGWQSFCAQAFRSLFLVGARWFRGGFSVQAGNSLQHREQLHSLQNLSE